MANSIGPLAQQGIGDIQTPLDPVDVAGGETAMAQQQGIQEAPPQEAPPGQGADKLPNPEDQEAYDSVIMAGMKILFENEETRQAILERLTAGAENPADAMAELITLVMIQMDEQSDNSIPDTVILPAALELLNQTGDLANSLGIFQVDEAMLDDATKIMVSDLAEAYGTTAEQFEEAIGDMNPDEVSRIAGGFMEEGAPVEMATGPTAGMPPTVPTGGTPPTGGVPPLAGGGF